MAMAYSEGADDMLNRVMPKDNIAIVALLEVGSYYVWSWYSNGAFRTVTDLDSMKFCPRVMPRVNETDISLTD